MGDFNSHNTIWGYDETNKNRKAVESWIDVKNLEPIHNPKPGLLKLYCSATTL